MRAGLLALALGLVLSVGLRSSPFLDFTSNEGRYAEVAQEMIVSGDYLVPRLEGHAMLTKPPLFYWLTAFAFRLGATDERARIISVIAAVVAALATWRLGDRLLGRPHGAIAAAMLATMLGFGIEARTLRPDSLVVALVVVGFLCLVEARASEGRRRTWWLAGMWLALGVGELAKGLVGLVIVLPVVAGLTWSAERGRGLRGLRPGLGLAVLLLVCVPWHAAVGLRQPGFLWDQFVNQHLLFFFDQKLPRDSEGISLAAFWGAFCFRSAPWLILLPLAAVRPGLPRGATSLPWLWLAWVLVFFSLSPSRLEHYALPALPAVALLAAAGATGLGERGSAAWPFLAVVSAILFVAGLVGLAAARPVLGGLAASLGVPSFAGLGIWASLVLVLSGSAACVAARRRSGRGWIVALGGAAAGLSVVVVLGEACLAPVLSWKPVADAIRRDMPPSTEIVFEASEEYQVVGGLAFYARRPIALLEPAGFVAPTFLEHEVSQVFLDRAEFGRWWSSERPVVLVTDPARVLPLSPDLAPAGSARRIGRVWLVPNAIAAAHGRTL